MIWMPKLRNTASVVMAAVLLFTAVTFATPPADAAEGRAPSVRFVNKVTGQLEQDTTILEGQSIKIVSSLLPGYSYIDPYFRTITDEYKGLDIFSVSYLDSGDEKGANNLTLKRFPFQQTTPPGASVSADILNITIRPQLQLFVTQSTSGTLHYEADDSSASSGGHSWQDTLLSAQIVQGNEISITDNGRITFKTTRDQLPDGTVSFAPAVATGGLAEFNGGEVTYSSGTKGNLVVRVRNTHPSGGSGKDLWLNLSSNIAADLLRSGAEFSLDFTLTTVNDLQMAIISEPKALDNIAKDINNTSFFNHFVKPTGDDTQNSITQGFRLLQTEKRYNTNDFKITWDFVPEASYTGPVFWKLKGSPGDEYRTISFLPNRPLGDVWVDLNATISHGNSPPAHATIRILVRGSGIMPSFTPQYAYTGVFNPNVPGGTTDAAVELGPTEWPRRMDVNDGSSQGFPASDPYKFAGTLDFGTGMQSASYVTIDVTSGDDADMEIYLNNNLTVPYQKGSHIVNPHPGGSSGNPVPVTIRATKPGTATVTINYYNDQQSGFNKSPESHLIAIYDTRPSSDARMRDIAMVGTPDPTADPDVLERFQQVYPGGVIDYGFDMDTYDYPMTMPWVVDSITLRPSYFHTSNRNGKIRVTYSDLNGNTVNLELDDHETSVQIPLAVGREQTINVVGVAEDGTNAPVYSIKLTRLDKSDDAFLQKLTFTTADDGVEQIAAQLGQVDLTMQFSFNLSLPYSYRGTQKAEISATTQNSWAQKPVIDPVSGGFMNTLRKFFNTGSAKVDLVYEKNEETGEVNNRNVFTVTVTSESGIPIVYTIAVTIEPPSENNQLASLEVYRDRETDPLEFDNGSVFTKEGRDFYLTIPYATRELRLELLPDDEKAQKVKVTWPAYYGGERTLDYTNKGTPLKITTGVPVSETARPEEMNFNIQIDVQAESDRWTSEASLPYTIHVTRSDPDVNSLLTSLTVTDAKLQKPVDTFSFNRQQFVYNFDVSYPTSEVFVLPVPESEFATATVNGETVSREYPGKRISLAAGATTTVVIVVTAEAGPIFRSTYTLNIKRRLPSSDARLLSMTINGGENMRPDQFIPSNVVYNVDIPKGTRGFTITATPVDPNATLTINGKATPNGKPSAPIETTMSDTRIPIVVTAEDGRTTKVYNVLVHDYNFAKKSSNAALTTIGDYYADLEPHFKPGILDYELYLKPETMYVDLSPETMSDRATFQVFAGSKQLTGYNGVYSTSILEDKTNFTIDVTAEDGTEREYTIAVFRNDKKKQGIFKPITADMVDWSENPIVIDISQYAVISGTVFNKLKTDYPDKSILFQGLDYSYKIKGSDISGLVPHTTTYDLSFSFSTPDQLEIEDALWDIGAYNAKPVYFHFNNHGDLPGRMIFTVNLGREYANRRLYWNYWNEERSRIDYYGYTTASAKGTFSVPLTHFSDYLATTLKLDEAMDMANKVQSELLNGYTGGSGNLMPPKLENPKTGVEPDEKEAAK